MQHSDATSCIRCFDLLWLFFLFFRLLCILGGLLNFKLANVLIHLIKAIVLLINDHLVLKHVFIVGDPNHGHSELLTGQRCELGRVECHVCLITVRKTTLLIRSLLE